VDVRTFPRIDGKKTMSERKTVDGIDWTETFRMWVSPQIPVTIFTNPVTGRSSYAMYAYFGEEHSEYLGDWGILECAMRDAAVLEWVELTEDDLAGEAETMPVSRYDDDPRHYRCGL
jgi:hypothetical protein